MNPTRDHAPEILSAAFIRKLVFAGIGHLYGSLSTYTGSGSCCRFMGDKHQCYLQARLALDRCCHVRPPIRNDSAAGQLALSGIVHSRFEHSGSRLGFFYVSNHVNRVAVAACVFLQPLFPNSPTVRPQGAGVGPKCRVLSNGLMVLVHCTKKQTHTTHTWTHRDGA